MSEHPWRLLAACGVGAVLGFCLARLKGRLPGKQGEAMPTSGPALADLKIKGRKAGKREVICEDALKWMATQQFPADAMVFTSLPDMSEVVEVVGPRFEDWEEFFMKAVVQILQSLAVSTVAVFYQTDVRLPAIGQVSKAFLVLKAAEQVPQVRLKWHKIVHFGTVDQPTWNAVQYTHLLCFAKGPPGLARVGGLIDGGKSDEVVDLGSTIPDVLERGLKPSGLRKGACCMGVSATAGVLKWVSRRLPGVRTVIDPFCGAGTVLAVANAFGLDAIGVDISPKRIKQAQRLDAKDLRPKGPETT